MKRRSRDSRGNSRRMPRTLIRPIREDTAREVSLQFQKKFQFAAASVDEEGKPPVAPLPPLDSVFAHEAYSVPSLQKVKQELNDVKNRLNDFEISDWHQHTRRRSSLQPVLSELRNRIGAEFVTQAFAKLYECVAAYDLVPPVSAESQDFYSVHLCEAPGAFITGLNHYLRVNREGIRWKWFANTLNPYYEGNCLGNMIPDDRFIMYTLDSWCFGEDFTGDIMRRGNLDEIVRRSREFRMVNLVTADGSIDCLDVPEAQEEHVSKLHLAEAVTALKILSKGGCFILKMFTFFEHSSVDLLYLLFSSFEELHVFKPCTSKPGNSEVYVIAKYFRKPEGLDAYLDRMFDNLGSDKAMFDLDTLPEDFVAQVRECAYTFMCYQQDVIEHNIFYYRRKDGEEERRLEVFKKGMCEEYFQVYRIRKIKPSEAILHGADIVNGAININPRDHFGTYNERSFISSITRERRLGMLKEQLNDLYEHKPTFMSRAKLTDRPLASYKPCLAVLQLYCGKTVRTLLSSKFAVITYVRFLRDVMDSITLFISDKQEESPPLFTLTRSTYTLTIDIAAYAALTNQDCYEKELFRKLFQCITDLPLQEGIDHLIVENWLLLTQFSVGLLFYLKTYVFEQLELIGLTQLKFSRLKADGIASMQFLNEALQSEQTGCSGTGKSVLGIVPIPVLFDGSFYYAVINYNNALCLEYCTALLEQ